MALSKNRDILGFTFIEMIIVLILIAVLAGIAIPRFINQTSAAQQNSTNSLAAALSAACAENFAKRSANASAGQAIANCTGAGNLLQNGLASGYNGLPSGYTITSLAISTNASANCTLNGSGGTTAIFVGLGVS